MATNITGGSAGSGLTASCVGRFYFARTVLNITTTVDGENKKECVPDGVRDTSLGVDLNGNTNYLPQVSRSNRLTCN